MIDYAGISLNPSGSSRSKFLVVTTRILNPRIGVMWRTVRPWSRHQLCYAGIKIAKEGAALDIPNELNKLLARLQEVTRGTSGATEIVSSGPRPNAIEIDFFLSQYNFDLNAEVERVEISKDGVFEFYLFAVSNRATDEMSLLAMWPQSRRVTDEREPEVSVE
jgi:hypothetical protein